MEETKNKQKKLPKLTAKKHLGQRPIFKSEF